MALHISNKSTFRERYTHSVAHDDVIEQPNIDQPERFLHPLGDEFVGLTRLGNPGRMLGCISRCNHHLQRSFSDTTVRTLQYPQPLVSTHKQYASNAADGLQNSGKRPGEV